MEDGRLKHNNCYSSWSQHPDVHGTAEQNRRRCFHGEGAPAVGLLLDLAAGSLAVYQVRSHQLVTQDQPKSALLPRKPTSHSDLELAYHRMWYPFLKIVESSSSTFMVVWLYSAVFVGRTEAWESGRLGARGAVVLDG